MGFDLLLAFVLGIRPPFAFKKVSSVSQRSVDNERRSSIAHFRAMSVFETSVGSLESCFTQSACIIDSPEDRYFTSSHTLFKNLLALFFSGHNRDVSLWTAGSNGHLLWTGGYGFLLAKKSISAILHPYHIRVCEITKVVRSQFHLHRILIGDAMQIQKYRSLRVSPWFYTTVFFGFVLRFVYLLLSMWTYLYWHRRFYHLRPLLLCVRWRDQRGRTS